MTTLWQNLRYALRQLRRSPGFAVTAVLTLALGVGANTAIFSLLDQALLRSLPVRDPQQLVVLKGTGTAWQGRTSGHGGDRQMLFSYPMYRDLRDKGKPFTGLIATTTAHVGLSSHGNASIEDAEIVTGSYFQVLGVQPALGRLLADTDDATSGVNQIAVLSYEYWRDHMGADRGIVGQTIGVNGQPVSIVGVAAPVFRSAVWGQTPALFVPIGMIAQIEPSQAKGLTDHKDRWLNVVGRLRNGETEALAEAELAPLWHALRAEELKALGKRSPSFIAEFLTNSRLLTLPGARGLSYSREGLEKPLFVVMGMALLVLLIASVNVASLLLVRSASRVREISVRYALGATGKRIVGQLLLEGLLIGVAGAAVGTLLALPIMRVLNGRLTDPGDPSLFSTALDGRLLLFSLAVSLTVSVLFSLVPALQALKPDLVASLKQQGGTAGAARLGFRRIVVCLQVGLGVMLLIGSGLFVRTLQQLRHVDVGFQTSNLLTFGIRPELAGYTSERIAPLRRDVLAALAAIPGVEKVSGTDTAELADNDSGTNVSVEGYVAPPDEDLDIGRSSTTPDYFATLKEPIVAGRAFTDADDLQHPLVAIVNQSFARHYFKSDAAAVGKRMARGEGKNIAWMQIVGVSRDALHINLREPVKMTDFTPMLQEPLLQKIEAGQVTFYLRTSRAPAASFQDVRTVMHRIDPGLALRSMRTMDEQIDQILQNERLISLLAVSFGVLAALLAGIGLYGVLAYATVQRTREIGIRMALGSTRLGVSRLVLTDVLLLAGIGIGAAVPCALLLARTLRSQLYGVSPADPVTIVAVVLLMGLVALLAAVLPARHASNVNPNVALRTE